MTRMCRLADHKRKLQYHERTRRGSDGKYRLREPYRKVFVSQVHSPGAKLIGQ
jgi:hypothetical protein